MDMTISINDKDMTIFYGQAKNAYCILPECI